MTRPQVADGENGLEVWRVATDILNKEPWAAGKGWSSSLRVGGTTEVTGYGHETWCKESNGCLYKNSLIKVVREYAKCK
jgi:hypothetical protein